METFYFLGVGYFWSVYPVKTIIRSEVPIYLRNLETFVRNFIWETENLKILDPSFEKRYFEFTFFYKN